MSLVRGTLILSIVPAYYFARYSPPGIADVDAPSVIISYLINLIKDTAALLILGQPAHL